MDDTSRDPAITEDEIRALQFSAGDVAEIEQTILSFVDACHTRNVTGIKGKLTDFTSFYFTPLSYGAYMGHFQIVFC
ncbi:hypothetical protein C9175_19320 [Escherichia coli]|nr:hypothetical protein C9175_19320 [Escherichia coli]